MQNTTDTCTIGGLLHDIGKVIYRAGGGAKTHSELGYTELGKLPLFKERQDLLECLRFHHRSALGGAKLSKDSPAYIVYVADNIAAGADRRENQNEEGYSGGAVFNRRIPLYSVFNLLNGNNGNMSHSLKELTDEPNIPVSEGTEFSESDYNNIMNKLMNELRKICPAQEYINSMLLQLENILSFVPSSTCTNEVCDISLFDHSKITAAVGAAIASYLEGESVTDFKNELFDNEAAFMEKEAFLFFSCDFSGIQKFIYKVGSKNALKSLRSRSFFLELLMEYFADELLNACGMSRANILYTGGGHCYLLLPNTKECRERLTEFEKAVNKWLTEQFGTSLYLGCAWTPVCANALQNKPLGESRYPAIYKRLSREISARKLRRYTPDELRELNSDKSTGERECKICGVSSRLLPKEDICEWCAAFAAISSAILRENVFSVVTSDADMGRKHPSVKVPCLFGDEARFIVFVGYDEALRMIKEKKSVRVYSKNNPHTGCDFSTNLFMGDYVYDKDMETLAEESDGIKRLAVMRADIDDLGRSFIMGFHRDGLSGGSKKSEIYQTLSRTAALSRQLSLFFKYHINYLLREGFGKKQKVLIVYSGGDDVFLIGSWNDIIKCTSELRTSFRKFCGNSLTLSAGISIYPHKYPIYRAAVETERLVEKSKSEPGKDSVTLFDDSGKYTYKWGELTKGVFTKIETISSFIGKMESSIGNSFLYRLMQLLRGSENKINIARCAYTLTRLEPKSGSMKEPYKKFAKDIMQYAIDEKERRELITAIQIYVYLNRKRGE